MNSLIQPIRFISCKTISATKGERLTRNFLYNNYCFLCGPSTIISHNSILHQSVQNFASSTPTLIIINFDGRQSPRKIRDNGISSRGFHSGSVLFIEPGKPSSKVEETVKALKEAKHESDQLSQHPQPTAVAAKPVVKKSLKQRVIDECLHYYHGFRLLFIDINVSRKLLSKILHGNSLTRREQKLLVRTVGDMFRLVPFSVFIIVPFMEIALPFFIKLFPGMLPSTFQTATEKEDKIKRAVKVKLEMAKFLQRTLDELPVASKGGHSSESAKEFGLFFEKVRGSGGMTTTEEIMKFSKLFADEITLDSMPRPQLMALCRVLEINPIGPTNVLRFQLRLKLRSLNADDLMIEKEGLESLSQSELQSACRARGMPAIGVPEERLHSQLEQWLDLSLTKKVPPSLLLLSQAFMLPDTVPTSEKLAQTISALPDTVGTRTRAVIGEREGKVDHKTKIELIQEEVKAIKEEKKELLEEAEKVERQKIREEEKEIRDTAPIIQDTAPMFPELRAALANLKKGPSHEISAKDIQTLDAALDILGKHKNDLLVEKEELEDLRQEMFEYQEDIADLEKVTTETGTAHDVSETKAARRLFKKLNNMISKVDTTLLDLDTRKRKKEETLDIRTELQNKASDGVLRLDELLAVMNKMELDKARIERITQVLDKVDTDKDGLIRLDAILKIIDFVGTDDVPLNQNQLDEIISLVSKEEVLEMNEQIAKALKKDSAEKSELESDPLPDNSKAKKSVKNNDNAPDTAIAESSGASPISEPKKSNNMKL